MVRPVAVVGIAALVGAAWLWLRNSRATADDLPIAPPGGGGGSVSVSIPGGGIPGGPEGGAYVPPPQTVAPPRPPPEPLTKPTQNSNFLSNPLNVWHALGLAPASGQHQPAQAAPPAANPPQGGGYWVRGHGLNGESKTWWHVPKQQREQRRAPSAAEVKAAAERFRAQQQARANRRSYVQVGGGQDAQGRTRLTTFAPNPHTRVARGLSPKTLKGAAGPLLPGQTRGTYTKSTARKGSTKTGIGAYRSYQAGLRQTTVAKTPVLQKKRKPVPGKTADDILAKYAGYRAGTSGRRGR